MGYGTGAIMAVPGQDERDWEFATRFGLPIVRTVQPPRGLGGRGLHRATARAINSGQRRGRPGRAGGRRGQGADHRLAGGAGLRPTAPSPTSCATGCSAGSATGVSRSRSSTTRTDLPSRCPTRCCRSSCRRSTTTRRRRSPRTTPTARAGAAAGAQGRLGRGRRWTWATGRSEYRRETNTMPQWAGSCWYELRYLDPTNTERFVDPEVERYWMGPHREGAATDTGGVDLYVGGAEHAVLHLLYARFWHKVLFDLGHVSSERAVPPAVQPGHDPGVRLHRRARQLRPGRGRGERDVDGQRLLHLAGQAGQPRVREDGQEPEEHGHARTTCTTRTAPTPSGCTRCRWARWTLSPAVGDPGRRRLAAVPAAAVAQRRRRGDRRGAGRRRARRTTRPGGCCTARSTGVREDMDGLRANTAIARLIELNNHVVKAGVDAPRDGRRGAGADGGAAGAAHRRGAVVPAGARRSRWPTSRSRWPTRRCWSVEHGHLRPAGRRQGARPHRGARRRSARTSCASWRWPREAVQRALDGRDVRTVVVRAPQAGQRRTGVRAATDAR